MFKKFFTEHPHSIGENYFQHMASAFSFGLRMLAAGLACLVHGFLPSMFERTGSTAITSLQEDMITNRVRHPATVTTVIK